MKKKTLAAASLLLALLMPLGVTPLAVYAEGEGEGTTQSETSTGSGVSAGTGETEPLENEQIRVQTSVGPRIYYADNFREAIEEALDGSTIELGAGTYSLYKSGADDAWDNMMNGKTFTFVGQSPEKTFWRIGAEEYQNKGGEYDSDYSFKGSQSVTFKNMKLYVPYDKNYLGFSHTNVTVVEDCIIEGRTAYWGYKSATFTRTTFNAPTNDNGEADYAIWTYSSPEMTFDNCTFNGKGKIINVYTDFGAGKNDITVNFNNCTVNSTFSSYALFSKPALNINDSNMGDYKYILKINNSTATAARDSVTCSQVFGFGGKPASNSGRTDVYLDGQLVFADGKQKTHSYTDGEHNQAYTYTGDWSDNWQRTEGNEHLRYRTRTRTKICDYCGHSETLPEEREEKMEYLLRYDLNGGTGAENANYSDNYYFEPTDGNKATVAAAPSRAGYQFAGWQDKDGNQYAAGDAVTVNHDITLTAQWNKLVTVSFDLCGHGGANISNQTFVSGNKASEPTTPKEDGWVFGGWYTEKGCKYRFSFDSAVTSDIILYAKWDRVTTVVSAPVATPTPTPSPAPAAAATKTATVKNTAIPQTSDAFPMEGLLALLAIGAVGFGAAGWLRKKHH